MTISSVLSVQIKKLDDSEFRNAFSRAYIRVCHNICAFKIPVIILVLLIYYHCLGEGV